MDRDAIYVGGGWVPSEGAGRIEVLDPFTESAIGSVPAGSPADVERAVGAAAEAFPEWSATPVGDRAKVLEAVGEALAERAAEIGALISKEVGMPKQLSVLVQAGLPVADFRSAAAELDQVTWAQDVRGSLVVREPVGVVGAITPWNYPLHQVAAKVSAALGAGCTVVVKPSEVAPLSAFVLAEVLHEVGLPPGVFNLVSGTGPEVGEAIAASAAVDMVSFTGSTRAGRRVMELAASSVKRVALELGGKSPNVILEDADLARAVPAGVASCFLNSGQTCSALTRMIVPRSRLAEVEGLARESAEGFEVGDPASPTTRLGPLVSAAQRDRVRSYIRRGLEEGAMLVTGGAEPPEGHSVGYFVRPTVFSGVTSEMTVAREEIFGPVLCILAYDTEEEAIAIANDSPYGLSGAVWAADPARAEAVARRLRTGQVEVNGGSFNPVAPFGGYKQSGIGRELGRFGIEEFLEVKALLR